MGPLLAVDIITTLADTPPLGCNSISSLSEVRRARNTLLRTVRVKARRKGAAKRLHVRAPILDRLVKAKRPTTDDGKQGRAISFPEPEPWPDSVDGAELLDGIAAAHSQPRFCPPHPNRIRISGASRAVSLNI
jgi:hypothetical protein